MVRSGCVWTSQEVKNHAGHIPRINLASGAGARACNNILWPKWEFDAQSVGRAHLGGQEVAVLRPPLSMISGHGGCMTWGGAGRNWAWCTWTRMNVRGCMQQHIGGKALAGNAWEWLRGCWGVWWLCRWILYITRSPGKIHGSGGVGTGYDTCPYLSLPHAILHLSPTPCDPASWHLPPASVVMPERYFSQMWHETTANSSTWISHSLYDRTPMRNTVNIMHRHTKMTCTTTPSCQWCSQIFPHYHNTHNKLIFMSHMFCNCLLSTYMHTQLTNQLELFLLPYRTVTSNSHLPTMLSTLRTTKKDRIHSTPFYTLLHPSIPFYSHSTAFDSYSTALNSFCTAFNSHCTAFKQLCRS